MLVTAWILLVFFGLIAVINSAKYMVSSLNKLEVLLWLISIVITALSAGVIFGGLFR